MKNMSKDFMDMATEVIEDQVDIMVSGICDMSDFIQKISGDNPYGKLTSIMLIRTMSVVSADAGNSQVSRKEYEIAIKRMVDNLLNVGMETFDSVRSDIKKAK